MGGLAELLGIGLALAIAIATWMVVWRLRHPPRRTYAWAIAKGVPGDPSELDAPRMFVATELAVGGGIRCAAWDIRGDRPDGPAIICTPGWGDSKIGVLPRIDALCAHASRVIAWDPPGSGETPGTCPMGTREPAMVLEIARWLRREERVTRTIAHGWSLGGGVAVVAAGMDAPRGENLIDGVISESPYRFPWTPAFRVMRAAALPWRINGPIAMGALGVRLGVGPRWSGHGGFDRAEWAKLVRVPMVVIHGTADDICPIDDGRAIADSARAHARFVVIDGGGHNDLWADDRWKSVVADATGALVLEIAALGREMGNPAPRG